jgi:hypothetical protein
VSTDTATAVAPSDLEPATPVADDAQKTPDQIFRYSTWVHVGPGSEDCEDLDEAAGTVDCSNPLHFHAWCRLPNQFQHREIREKALAAKARKIRQLRDPETDASAILEEDLDGLARQGDDAKPVLVEELVGNEWWQDYMDAARDVQELEEGVDEDDDPIRPFERVERDQARFDDLAAMPEDQRPNDEFDELGRHLTRYAGLVKERQDELVKPKREALMARDVNALIDMVRDQRIYAMATDEFMHVYSSWSWLVGTLNQPGGEPVWPPDAKAFSTVAPEVIEAVRDAFNDLEQTQQRGLQGNS